MQLAGYSAVYAMVRFLSVCLSHAGTERIELVISTEASLDESYIVLWGNSVISKNIKDASPGALSQTLNFADFFWLFPKFFVTLHAVLPA